jgi:hypothetical protein
MTARNDLSGVLSDWLDEQAGRGSPDYLDEVLARTTRTRQRPAWSSLERWLPVDLALNRRVRPIPNLASGLAIVALLALIVVGLLVASAGQRRLPHFGFAANGAFTYVDGATLKIAAADGSNARVAAALPAGVDSLTFAPDGTHLAYRTSGIPASLVVASPDGSHAVVVSAGLPVAATAQAGVSPFAFSPDATRLAFTTQVDANAHSIEIVSADGTHPTGLFPNGSGPVADLFDPAWSADGHWIAFFGHDAASDVTRIYLVHPDGSAAHVLIGADPDPSNLEIVWSPDPARSLLAYVKGGDARGGAIAIRDATTSKEVIAGSGLWITWSPDGKQIAWWGSFTQVASVAGVLAGSQTSVALFPPMDGATCAAHPELKDKAICGPAQWSPDSTQVYGTDVSGTSIIMRAADGSGTIRTFPLDHPVDITNGPNGALAWQPVAP